MNETTGIKEIDDLSRAIERDPDAPVYYVLRGEMWLAYGNIEQAQNDFETAQALAANLLDESAWGYIYQAYLDRTEAGLRCCTGL